MMRYRYSLILLLLLLNGVELYAQAKSLWGRIGAVETSIERNGEQERQRFPILRLNSIERLRIGFDLLGDRDMRLVYRVRYCTRTWQETTLSEIDFLQGFTSYELDVPEFSRNTLMPYAHYSLSFPNEYTQFKLSGNYIVDIYREDTPEENLLSIPFAITEESLLPQAEVRSHSLNNALDKASQEVYMQINLPQRYSQGSEQYLYPIVLQNGRWDTAKALAPPAYRQGSRLFYDATSGSVFDAGNEYHKLEHISDMGEGLGVYSTEMEDALRLLKLSSRQNRLGQSYSYEEDQNGAQVIKSKHTDYPATEADYHWVDFTFVSPPLDGEVLIEGAFAQYLNKSERVLKYNEEFGAYTARLLLKMGYQEYQFVLSPRGGGDVSSSQTEGNHYQTSNDYLVLLYQHLPSDISDRLVGIKHISTAK